MQTNYYNLDKVCEVEKMTIDLIEEIMKVSIARCSIR